MVLVVLVVLLLLVVLVLLVGLVLVVPVLVLILVLVLVGGHVFIRIFKYAYAFVHTCVIYKDISLVLEWSHVDFLWFQGGSSVVPDRLLVVPGSRVVPGGSR